MGGDHIRAGIVVMHGHLYFKPFVAIQDEDYFKSSEQLQSSSCSTPIGSLSNLSNPFHIVQHECQLNMNFGFMYETNYSENVHTSNGSITSSSATSQPSPIGSSLGSTSSSSSGQLSSRPSSSPGSSSLVSSAQQTSFCLPSDVFLDDWFQVAGEHQMEEWEIAQDLVRGLETRLKGMIQWSMGIPEFSNLDEEAQVSLIQNSWCEQCILQLAVCNANRWGTSHGKDRCPTSLPSDQTWDMAVHQVMLEVVEVGYWLEHLGMDRMELAFLRRILLFDPGIARSISNVCILYSFIPLFYIFQFQLALLRHPDKRWSPVKIKS